MKKILLLFLISIATVSFVLHKYYVSITEINYSTEKQQIEISLKIFNDDLQHALDYKLGKPVNIGSHNEFKSLDSLISDYVKSNISIKANTNSLKLNMMGREIEGEATWIYLYSTFSDSIKSIEVKNTILTDMFDEQRNVIQVNMYNSTKSTLLTKSRSAKIFYFD